MLGRGVDEIHPAIDFTSIFFCEFRGLILFFLNIKKILKVFSIHVIPKNLKSEDHVRFTSKI
jgi:hypothetical protein